MKKLIKSICIFILIATVFTPVSAAADFSVSGSTSSVAPGASFYVNLSFAGEGRFEAKVSNGTITSATTFWYPDVKSVSVTAGSSGTVTVTIVAVDATASNEEPVQAGLSRSVSVNIASNNSGGNNGGGTTKPPVVDNTEKDKTNNQKTPAEIAAEKLEERKKTPLFTGLSVVSLSERQQGETLSTINTEVNVFEYRYILPKRVDSFKLDLAPLAEDVTLTYEKEHTFTEGQNEIEVIVKAIQDEVEQEIKVIITRPAVTNVTETIDGSTYQLVDDDRIDTEMTAFGVNRVNVMGADGRSVEKFYYEMGAVRLQLMSDEKDNAVWVQLDDKLAVLREVVLVSNEANGLSFLVDAPEDENRVFQGNKIKDIEVKLPESLTKVDSSYNYKKTIRAWEAEDDSLVGYGLNESGEVELRHLDAENNSKSAYVTFDTNNFFYMIWSYGVTGVLAIVLSVFGIYWSKNRRKVNALLARREREESEEKIKEFADIDEEQR